MPYQSEDKNRLIFYENLNRFNHAPMSERILYQKHKTDEELLAQEEVIKIKEKEFLKRRSINLDELHKKWR
ncbi:MAG: hypothetical protein IJ086_08605 [Clostridium sp.]|nr:hypothetical protein [Clostridium sp.]